MNSSYCSDCVAACPKCPRPKLLPESEPIVRAFLACAATQWRGNGSGLDYSAVQVALRADYPRATRRKRNRLFAGIRTIEAALMAAWQEQRKAREATHRT